VRQAAGHTSPVLTIGDLVIDTARMTAMVGGQQAQLSQFEFRLLNYLSPAPSRRSTAKVPLTVRPPRRRVTPTPPKAGLATPVRARLASRCRSNFGDAETK
jgi:hypothetical protein